MTYAADDGVLDGYNTSCLNSRLLIHEKAEKNVESVYPLGPQLLSFANIYKLTDVVHSSSGIHHR